MSFGLEGQTDARLSDSRRRGDTLYGVVSLAVFSAESLALGVLTWTFLLRLAGIVPGTWLAPVLIACVASAALAVLVLAVFTMAQHARVERSRGREQADVRSWTDRWMKVLFDEEPPPPAPLPAAAVASALNLRELLKGDEGERLVGLMRRYEMEADLVHQLGSARIARRIDALEALAMARLPEALEALRRLFVAPHPAVRLMAARAAARTLAVLPGGEARDRRGVAFAEDLCVAKLPSGVVLEALLLLDDAAAGVVEQILGSADRGAVVLRAATDAAGRLQLAALADDISQGCLHQDPELRAAAYRALASIGLLPKTAADALPQALRADAEGVRVQAAHAAHLLPAEVAVRAAGTALGDDSWWVRLASAGSLLRMGEPGIGVLEWAATDHIDRYARDMAAQTLKDVRTPEAGLAPVLVHLM